MSLLVNTRYVVIRQSPRSLLNRILGAVFFTAMLYCIYKLLSGTITHGALTGFCLMGVVFFFFLGFACSRSSNFVFDFKRHRFREEFQMGIFKMGAWEPMPDLEYVSISKFEDNNYPLKIYISENDSYLISGFTDAKSARAAAKDIGEKLELDVWDETIPGEGKLNKHQ